MAEAEGVDQHLCHLLILCEAVNKIASKGPAVFVRQMRACGIHTHSEVHGHIQKAPRLVNKQVRQCALGVELCDGP